MPAIPQLLTNCAVYFGPQSLIDLGMATVTLPAFEAMTETISGAGIAGEMAAPVKGHFTSQKVAINFRTPTLNQLSMLTPVFHIFDIRGSIQYLDPATQLITTQAITLDCRGPVNQLQLGSMEPGKQFGSSLEMEIAYIAITLNGVRVIELDKLNQVFKVLEVDHLASVRRDLGGM